MAYTVIVMAYTVMADVDYEPKLDPEAMTEMHIHMCEGIHVDIHAHRHSCGHMYRHVHGHA